MSRVENRRRKAEQKRIKRKRRLANRKPEHAVHLKVQPRSISLGELFLRRQVAGLLFGRRKDA